MKQIHGAAVTQYSRLSDTPNLFTFLKIFFTQCLLTSRLRKSLCDCALFSAIDKVFEYHIIIS